MGETVDAIGYKADVKGRAGDYVTDKKESFVQNVTGARDAITRRTDDLVGRVTGGMGGGGSQDGPGLRDRAGDMTSRMGEHMPSQGQMRQTANKAKGAAHQNPLAYAFGGVAIGFLIGSMLPSTTMEDERIGDLADDVKDRVKETGQEVLERGKEVVSEATQTAKETAKEGMQQTAQAVKDTAQESGQQHAQELAENAKQQAQELQETAQQRMPSGSSS